MLWVLLCIPHGLPYLCNCNLVAIANTHPLPTDCRPKPEQRKALWLGGIGHAGYRLNRGNWGNRRSQERTGVRRRKRKSALTRETNVKSVLLSREGGRFLYGTSAFARLVERRPKFPGLSLQRAGVPANDPSNR